MVPSGMPSTLSLRRALDLAVWRDVLWPREHGSWSLALEPLAFGLIAASSAGGFALAGVVTAAFFARRPLRWLKPELRDERTLVAGMAMGGCGVIMAAGLGAITVRHGVAWLPWLAPSLVGGAVFLAYDLRGLGRELVPEVAGAAAFAAVPAALATLAGWTPGAAASLGLIMMGRAVPTVLCVRAVLREQKTGEPDRASALVAVVLAFVGSFALQAASLAPLTAVVALALLAGRAGWLLVYPRPALRARTLGLSEAMLGLAFVVVVGMAWRA